MTDRKPYVYDPNPKVTFVQSIIAGGGAGVAEILIMYPLDVVKTRLQLQVTKAAASTNAAAAVEAPLYNSVAGCFRHIIKTEGFGRLYRGIASPILAEAPKRAVKFSTNDAYKKLFTFIPDMQARAIAAGAMAGVTEAFVNCPFEVVKVRMQARQSDYKNTMDAVTRIVKTEGIGGIYSGLMPQIYRNAVWNGVYFGIIFKLKSALWTPESKNSELLRNFISGLVGGGLATTANTPLDVVKSRMQNMKSAAGASGINPTVVGTLAKIYREEGGVRALWKGWVPRMYRLGPGGGIMLVAFDWISGLFAM